ncbi:MAG: NADP-dependent phosphogluconate dehydrogenase [Burkholderiaceae bacterium]|nr:NADP-dependent phosphogluconate dehydrogenase [Burkholderiaceae bacterium]
MQIGLIGLGVMGRNLALNMAERGLEVVATDPWPQALRWAGAPASIVPDVATLLEHLRTPRTIVLLVKAGRPVDALIDALLPRMAPGDLVVDAGNSDYRDAGRRAERLSSRSVGFADVGVSGGAEGARRGPAMMIGGAPPGATRLLSLLSPIAARSAHGSCARASGGPGAGHFVKMVHNGIEYALMQSIADLYQWLREARALAPTAIADLLEQLHGGERDSYLARISVEVLRSTDPDTGAPMIDVIDDGAGQKGTGGWCVEAGLAHGVALPTIMAAVAMRQASADARIRRCLVPGEPVGLVLGADPTRAPDARDSAPIAASALGDALAAASMTAFAQGLNLIEAAAIAHGWTTSIGDVLRGWTGGSILQGKLLEPLIAATSTNPGDGAPVVSALLSEPTLRSAIVAGEPALARLCADAAIAGVAVPALAASLGWIQAVRAPRLSTALVQAQRDRFGAHGFRRTDRDGVFHGPWAGDPT